MPHHPTRVHAFGDDALGHDDAVGLVARLRAGTVSRRELVEAAVARVQRVDPDLHAVACERYADAVAEARSDHPGFFAGLPSFVKDNSDVAGLPTQQGSRAYAARPARANGDVGRAFATLGLTVLGKTRLSEYGFSASAEQAGEPAVRSPWDLTRTAGASSSGAAALVAAGAVPLAHANDGGGSIRIPAAVNGLVGLKASRGRLPSDRANREMPVRIVHDGVVTRSVRDTAAYVRESERAYRDLTLPPVGDVTRPGRKRQRVALATESLGGRTVAPAVLAVVHDTARLLEELGHRVEPVAAPAPESFVDDFLDYWAFLALAITTTGRRRFGPDFDPSRHDELTRGLADRARTRLWRLPSAVRRLRRAPRLSAAFFADHDLVLCPTVALPTPRVGWLDPTQPYETVVERLQDWVAFTPLQNVTGDPAVSLPLGVDGAGRPVGVQLAGPMGHDRRVLEVALELEQARPFARIDA
ncbi:amidase [Nocardioides marmoraquaticus]